MARSAENAKPLSCLVVINRRSGTVRTRGPEQVRDLVEIALAQVFHPLTVTLVDGDVSPVIEAAIRNGKTDVIIAGGGDGTITSAAALVRGTRVILGALPLGTMNLFVRALGFSPVLEEALAQMEKAVPQDVDVGIANERVFLHQVSFGLQPRMAKLRERMGYRSRVGKLMGTARAMLMLAVRPKLVRVNIIADGEKQRVSSPYLAITNNPIGSDKHWSVQHRLDGGILGYYTLTDYSLRTLFRLARGYLRNRMQDDEAVENRTAQRVLIKRRPRSFGRSYNRFKMRRGLLSSVDGEVVVLKNPVSVRIVPKALRVLAMPEAVSG